MIDHALQIATIKVLATRMSLGIPRLGARRIVGRITIGKAFRKNLIPNRLFHPFWRVKGINILKIRHSKISIGIIQQLLISRLNKSLVSIDQLTAFLISQLKSIRQTPFWFGNGCLPIIIHTIRVNFFHWCWVLVKFGKIRPTMQTIWITMQEQNLSDIILSGL